MNKRIYSSHFKPFQWIPKRETGWLLQCFGIFYQDLVWSVYLARSGFAEKKQLI